MRQLLALMVLSSLAAPVALAADSYVVGEGDSIAVHVFGEGDLTRTYRVDDRCRVEVGLIGRVEVCERSTADVAEEIRERLADGYLVDPLVSVDVTEYGSRTVLVTGEVMKATKLALDGPTTLLEAIVAAGGRKEENVIDIQVVRRDGTVEQYDFMELASAGDNVFVKAGDRVVLREGQLVWVSGEVKDEGPVTYRDGLTVSQALAMAGGPGDYARTRRAYIVRQDGEKVVVNLQRILGGRDADVSLNPDDKLVIPRAGVTF